MNLFASMFSLSASDSENLDDELNVTETITAHVSWKVRLQKYVDGKSEEIFDPMLVCRDDQCALGRWIHGPATERFHADEAFHALRSDHAQFHYVAANVVRYVQEGDKAGAQSLLKGEYSKVSHHVVMMLLELNKHKSE